MRKLFFIFILLVSGCSASYDAERMEAGQRNHILKQIAPFVIKKPDEFSYKDRVKPENFPFYENFMELTESKLAYYHATDTANFFFFEHRDLTSLYEHYRGLGGYFRNNKNDSIIFINLLYHTPRFTREEMDKKGRQLFEEMAEQGNVNKYIGNQEFIHTPNDDFYYNTKTNRWDYTENSSWKFLEEAREAASGSDSIR